MFFGSIEIDCIEKMYKHFTSRGNEDAPLAAKTINLCYVLSSFVRSWCCFCWLIFCLIARNGPVYDNRIQIEVNNSCCEINSGEQLWIKRNQNIILKYSIIFVYKVALWDKEIVCFVIHDLVMFGSFHLCCFRH